MIAQLKQDVLDAEEKTRRPWKVHMYLCLLKTLWDDSQFALIRMVRAPPPNHQESMVHGT